MLFETEFLTNYSLVLLRIIVAIVIYSSGMGHVRNPKKRGESIGMSPAMTFIVGLGEVVAAVSIALGIFAQIGAAIIVLIMAGAVFKKIFEWKTGFYADKGYGWHYDLFILIASLVIFTTAGGDLVLV